MDPHDAVAQGFPVCRICHGDAGDTQQEELLAPCLCIGSVQWSHRGCLETWLRSSRTRSKGSRQGPFRCELCDFPLCTEQRLASTHEALRQLGTKALILSVPAITIGLLVGYCLRYDVGILVAGAFVGLWAVVDAALALVAAVFGAFAGEYPGFGHSSLLGSSLQRLTCNTDLHCEELHELTGFSRQHQHSHDRARGEHDGDEDDGSADSRLRKLPSGCRLMLFVFPTMLPQVFTSALFWLREILGPDELSDALNSLSTIAGGYYPFALALAALTTVKRPPKVIIRAASGLPKFRSMSLAERELLKLDRSPPSVTAAAAAAKRCLLAD